MAPHPLLVVDAPSVLFRAYYALPDSIKGRDGMQVNALLGSVNVMLRVIEDFSPRAIVMCFGQDAADYRTDLFEKYGKEFADKLGYELKPPTNWKQFDEIAKFFTQKLSPDLYGASFIHGTTWNQFMFIPHFKANGGKFFDPASMKPVTPSARQIAGPSFARAACVWMSSRPGTTILPRASIVAVTLPFAS